MREKVGKLLIHKNRLILFFLTKDSVNSNRNRKNIIYSKQKKIDSKL